MDEKKKKEPTVAVVTEAGVKQYPAEPSLYDRLKEGFEPVTTRANLDAVRARRQKYGS